MIKRIAGAIIASVAVSAGAARVEYQFSAVANDPVARFLPVGTEIRGAFSYDDSSENRFFSTITHSIGLYALESFEVAIGEARFHMPTPGKELSVDHIGAGSYYRRTEGTIYVDDRAAAGLPPYTPRPGAGDIINVSGTNWLGPEIVGGYAPMPGHLLQSAVLHLEGWSGTLANDRNLVGADLSAFDYGWLTMAFAIPDQYCAYYCSSHASITALEKVENALPEPTTAALMGAGLALLGAGRSMRARRRIEPRP